MHQFEKPSMKAWDYIEEAQETLQDQTHKEFWRHTPGYQVAAVMYILLTLAKPCGDWRDEYLARNLANKIFSQKNFNCTQEQADKIVQEIRLKTEPQLFTLQPIMPIEEIFPDFNAMAFYDEVAPDLQYNLPLITEPKQETAFTKLITYTDTQSVLSVLHQRIDGRKGKDIGIVLAAAAYKYKVLTRTPTEAEFKEEFQNIQQCSWRSISHWLTKVNRIEDLAKDIMEVELNF